jgi:NAD+ diphosphatase
MAQQDGASRSFFDGMSFPEASSRTAYAGNRIDRRSELRTADSVPTALADETARVYVFRGDPALVKPGLEPLFTPAETDGLGVERANMVLLGWTTDGPRLAATIAESVAIDEARTAPINLRALAIADELSADHLGALAQARSLLNWHGRHRFCSNCGAATKIAMGGYRRDCPACATEHFPRTDPVVIMLAIDGERALLGRSARFQARSYSCLAGFMEPGETIEDAVRRETHEESGIRIGRVRYFASQPWPFPASLMIGCHCEALSTEITRDEAELEDCRWFSRDEIRSMLAGTHPNGLVTPVRMAIANHIIRAWAEG